MAVCRSRYKIAPAVIAKASQPPWAPWLLGRGHKLGSPHGEKVTTKMVRHSGEKCTHE